MEARGASWYPSVGPFFAMILGYLQNAMTSSEERPSACIEAAGGCHRERTLMELEYVIGVPEQILGENQDIDLRTPPD